MFRKTNLEIHEVWPNYNEEILKDDRVNIVVQINGKKRDLLNVERDILEDSLLKYIKTKNNLEKYFGDKDPKKIIFIKNKIINIIIYNIFIIYKLWIFATL